MRFTFHPYTPDSRGTKLVKYDTHPHPQDGNQHVLRVCCSPEIERQIEALAGGAASKGTLTDASAEQFTAGYLFGEPVSDDLLNFLELLKSVVTLTQRDRIDIATSLDWYKVGEDSGELRNTGMGQCVNHTKHAPFPNGRGSKAAWRLMCESMIAFVQGHPFYAAAGIVTAPPGHLADGNSWGERLAKEVARATGKPYVSMKGSGPRPERKDADNADLDLTDEFTLDQRMDGHRVIIIDDVFHTGTTLDAAASACREAGAVEVLTATVARTLRK